MKKIKQIISLTLICSMLCGVTAMARSNSTSSDDLADIVAELRDAYSEYYNINGISVTFCSQNTKDDLVEKVYLVELDVNLHAASIDDLDYVQGFNDYCKELQMNASVMNTTSGNAELDKMYAYQMSQNESLSEDIKDSHTLSFYVKETYVISDRNNKFFLFEDGMEYVPIDKILPMTQGELYERGYAAAEATYQSILSCKDAAGIRNTLYSYEKSEAVSYMRTYTSNPTVCSVCGSSSCSGMANTAKYNSNYSNYASSHSDCANYVSQALCNGGIPTSSTWYPCSTAWINVSSLIAYMGGNGYWSNVSASTAQRGDVIKFTSSHVAMITYFDGVTYGYSAHTHDRKDYTISSSSLSNCTLYRP